MRVNRILGETKFDAFTNKADRDCQYSYNNFLKAVAKYPAFCNESAAGDGVVDKDAACRAEIAALFSHMSFASGDFKLVEEEKCASYKDKADCARGPAMIKKEEYGEFGASFLEGLDRSDTLMAKPEIVAEDGYYGFSSAIWKYMKINTPGPSAHSCMTGFFEPNGGDRMAGHTGGFGTSIFIMQDSTLCGTYAQTDGAKALVDQYNANRAALGLKKDVFNLGCERAWSEFSWNSSQNKQLFFQLTGWGANKTCKIANWKTDFTAADLDGYKKCICSGSQANDPNCQQDTADYNKDPEAQ